MTTPRDIIAGKLPTTHRHVWAQEIIDALNTAGFRILGPDEVDPVTVEKAAAIAESTQAYGDPVDASVGLGPVGKRIASAIRALGRKA